MHVCTPRVRMCVCTYTHVCEVCVCMRVCDHTHVYLCVCRHEYMCVCLVRVYNCGVCVCVRLYTQAPQARAGATLKDGANLPLATLCHWISQSRHNALHLWRRRDSGSSPLQRPWSSQSPAGAWHTESLSTWSRCRGDSLAGGPVPGQMGSLQGVKPGLRDPLRCHQCPAGGVSAQGLRP